MSKTYVLIGMPGAGKTTVGRRLAARLGLPFTDSDLEIEAASGLRVAEIFERYGEAEFRAIERKTIARLLEGPAKVVSTGGGAFMNEETRALIKQRGISLWLKAELTTILPRCLRHGDRPLLKQGDPEQILKNLIATRGPVYALADVTLEMDDRPVDVNAARAAEALKAFEQGL